MILGVVFLVLGVTAVLLQAWLWSPKFWDEVAKRTRAPRLWLKVHRYVGYAFLAIYVVMMWQMVPRLWVYQMELPARTVLHALAAIVLGVLLLAKISILKFFRHFEEAMPKFGIGILICTVVLSVLSLPLALRVHATSLDAGKIARVRRLMAGVPLGPATLDEVSALRGLEQGRKILVTQCVLCHDLRTVLMRPRTAEGWHDVVVRMVEKPMVFGDPIGEREIPFVVGYLVAITPDIQTSAKSLVAQKQKGAIAVPGDLDTKLLPVDTSAEPPLDIVAAKELTVDRCTQCHDMDDIEKIGGADQAGWAKLVKRMVVDEGAKVKPDQGRTIVRYLAHAYPMRQAAPQGATP